MICGTGTNPGMIEHIQKAARDAMKGIAPRDPIEGLLGAQMVATHEAAMEYYRRAALVGQTFEGRQAAVTQASKPVRSFAMLTDSLNLQQSICRSASVSAFGHSQGKRRWAPGDGARGKRGSHLEPDTRRRRASTGVASRRQRAREGEAKMWFRWSKKDGFQPLLEELTWAGSTDGGNISQAREAAGWTRHWNIGPTTTLGLVVWWAADHGDWLVEIFSPAGMMFTVVVATAEFGDFFDSCLLRWLAGAIDIEHRLRREVAGPKRQAEADT